MKKILFVINTLGRAGAELAMMELLRRLSVKDDYQISLYVILGQGELLSEVPENVQLLNTNYKPMEVLSDKGRREIAKTVIRSYFHNGQILKKTSYLFHQLMRMIKSHDIKLDKLFWRMLSDGGEYLEEEYDLAVAYIEGAATYFVADHVKAKKKAAFIHIDYVDAGYTKEMDQGCYQVFDRIFTVSDGARDTFLQVYPECLNRTFVFHNILNRERILHLAGEGAGFADDFIGIRILTVGRLTYQKGYDIAIDAMAKLKAAGYPIRWYVLGEGDQRTNLEKQIKKLGLEQDFLLLGEVENPYPYYKECDIYVHATRFEGWGIAIQEAMILGCAVIASDCSGNREQLISGEDGILCELTSDAICESIIKLIDDEEMRKHFAEIAATRVDSYDEEMNLLLELL